MSIPAAADWDAAFTVKFFKVHHPNLPSGQESCRGVDDVAHGGDDIQDRRGARAEAVVPPG